jgi:hypothetical protein
MARIVLSILVLIGFFSPVLSKRIVHVRQANNFSVIAKVTRRLTEVRHLLKSSGGRGILVLSETSKIVFCHKFVGFVVAPKGESAAVLRLLKRKFQRQNWILYSPKAVYYKSLTSYENGHTIHNVIIER